MNTKRKTLIAVGAFALVAAFGGVAIAAGDGDDVAITGDALEQASQAALDHLGEGSVTDTEVGDEESYYEVEVTLDDGTEVDVQLDEEFNVVGDEYENESDDEEGDEAEDAAEGEDVAITGDALEQASQAALDHLGEGRVTDTEVGDEESYYEVEVTLDDGSEVDVQLDEEFNVVGTD